MLELHCCNSPNNEKVFVLLEELGLEYEVRYRSIWKLEQFAPEFLALNPNAKMPVIVDGDVEEDAEEGDPIVVFESGVILQYLAEKHGRFLPRNRRERFSVLQWVMFQMANVGPVIGNYFHFRRFAAEGNEYALTRFGNEARRLYGVMETRLAESAWLGGSEYTIADMAVYPWVVLHPYSDVDLDAHPALADWLGRCAARPAVARAYEKTESFRAGFDETIAATPPEVLDRVFRRDRPSP